MLVADVYVDVSVPTHVTPVVVMTEADGQKNPLATQTHDSLAVVALCGTTVIFGQLVFQIVVAVATENAVVGAAQLVGKAIAFDDVAVQKEAKLNVEPTVTKAYPVKQFVHVIYVPLLPLTAVVTETVPEHEAQLATPYGAAAVPEPVVVQAIQAVPTR